MKKELFERAGAGFAATVLVNIVIQTILAQMGRSVVTRDFAARFLNETAAVLVQLGLTGLIGATFAGASFVFDCARWSFLKQGILHFLITAAVWVPTAVFCWTPDSIRGAVYSGLGWIATYAIIWIIQYFILRSRVREINRRLESDE